MLENGKILGIDPGEKNIGIAISDITGTIARPLQVIRHVSRLIDAGIIAQIARDNLAVKIIIGYIIGEKGEMLPQSRHAQKLADAVQNQVDIPIILWDESNSTQIARQSRIELNVPVTKRRGHQDALAAAVILQSYLDASSASGESNE